MGKILTLITVYPYIEPETMNNILNQDYQGENDIFITIYNPVNPKSSQWGENIAFKQNKARKICLDNDYTHIFSLENDVVPPFDALSRLLAAGKDIIAGIYNLHSHSDHLKGKPTVFRKTPQAYVPLTEGVDFKSGEIIETDLICFGCTLIKANVLQNIGWFDTGLDLSFSIKCHEQGYKLWVDTGIKCKHVDRYTKCEF